MDNYIIQITLGILIILWTYYVLRIVFVGVKIQTKTTKRKTTKRKKYPLKTRLLKKLRKQARKVCYIRVSIRNKRPYYTIEVMQDCSHIYGKKFGVLLFGTYKKEEAIEEMNYIRRQWILSNVCENKDRRLALRLAEMNKELAKL
jgi:hypothetical protein